MENINFFAAPQGRKFLQTTVFGSEYFTEVLISENELLDNMAVIQQIHRQMNSYILDGYLDLATGTALMKSIVSRFAKCVNPSQLFYIWHNYKQSYFIDKHLFQNAYIGLYQ